jgi:hypothetical protein
MNFADRVEQSDGPSRELDAEIFQALGIVPSREHYPIYPAYAFTASIDAALTLVPEGYGYGVADPKHGVAASGLIFNQTGLHIECRAATPALALCAAALRTREQD